ncbi:MAG: 3-hydroxyacyl-CoA dehydrogenase family protein [Geminicoccaceae bacterium]|nr:MAG: 3-hydroxyacyl-CoA dehydrogenase family protein [Geminicoccaceae bacterium]
MAILTLGIVGAGTMGSGIAIASAAHGLRVRLVDAQPSSLAKAKADAESFYARQAEKGRMTGEAAAAAGARIEAADDVEDLADCDLVIEAVFEDFDLKARLFRSLADVLRPDCLVATNTSCLKVSDLQANITQPERFLGLHYFSPAQVNPIVEVVRGAATSAATFEAAMAFCRATGKDPLPCNDQYGFAINRFFCPYTNEAARCLDEGLGTTGEIDAVAKDALGAAAGPFFVMNIIKPRINLHAIRNLGPLGPFYAPAASMVATGDGDGKWTIETPGEVPEARAGAIADRLRLGAFLPTLQALDEGVAEPAVIDHGAQQALKLAKPPCALMDQLGRGEVERILQPALDRYGVPAPRSLARVGSLVA